MPKIFMVFDLGIPMAREVAKMLEYARPNSRSEGILDLGPGR
jgi:hypothetical protein